MIELFENGYSIFKGSDNNKLDNFFKEQIEFEDKTQKQIIFSAISPICSTPSSFHHADLRTIRKNIYNQFVNQFKMYFPKMKFRMLFGCLYIITTNSKHVDCEYSADFPKNDLTFAGFVNLNESGNQNFHFKKIGEDNNNINTVIVKPKCIILYDTKNIKECDLSIGTKNEYDYRLYFAFNLSKNDSSIFDENLISIEDLRIPMIYNGNIPELYSDNDKNKWGTKLKHYSKRFNKYFLNTDSIVNNKLSLKDFIEKEKILFKPYTPEDKQIHRVIML